MRPSIAIARTTEPAYSTTWPRPPAMPSAAMIFSATSLAVTCAASAPSSRMRIDFGRFIAITCVARMCASSVVPQPNAMAPSPPTVEAWLSGTAWVAPGSTMPTSGATTCEMPCSGSPRSNTRMPFRARALAHGAQERRARRIDLVGAARAGGDRVVLHRKREIGARHRCGPAWRALRTRAARAAHAAHGGRYRSGRGRPCGAPRNGRPRFSRTGFSAWWNPVFGLAASRCCFVRSRYCGRARGRWQAWKRRTTLHERCKVLRPSSTAAVGAWSI